MTGLLRFSWKRFLAQLTKEFELFSRDRSYLGIGLGLPIMMLLIFGYGMSMDVKDVPVSVVTEEHTPAAVALEQRFAANGFIVGNRAEGGAAEAESLFTRREAEAIVRIPAGFAEDVAAGRGEVGLTLYGVDSNTAQMIRSYVNAVVAKALADPRLAASSAVSSGETPVVTVSQRLWFNEASNSTWYLVPGLLVIVTSVSGSFLGSLVIAREWERGTLTALYATPAASLEILLSKLIPCAGIALAGFMLCLGLALLLFEVPLRGDPFWLLATAVLYSVATASLGLFISATVKSQFLATECAIMASFMPTMMLSGFLFDLRSVPVVIEWIGKCFPPSYAIESLKICFLSGGAEHILATNCALMLGWTAVLLIAALRKLSKTPVRYVPAPANAREN
ncbi:ABC transporter permease [Sutterella sp.]|uniref:ABC transporter permease n=1 Tax=Sutterella sp. TaxID=1981025 RepID=UPI0026E0867E|nr:ABC transporter permease [Sutterella sp.]MDO5531292.1 ABC transporter permease [Sutterella sp.]